MYDPGLSHLDSWLTVALSIFKIWPLRSEHHTNLLRCLHVVGLGLRVLGFRNLGFRALGFRVFGV